MSRRVVSPSPASADFIPGPRQPLLGIFAVSVLGLFLELLLIRWVSTEIRIFAYLQNTVLVVCFLGLGMGCFTARRPIQMRRSLVALTILGTLLAVPWTRNLLAQITTYFSHLNSLLIWQEAGPAGLGTVVWQVAAALALTFGLMILLWEVFLPIGRILGRLMDDYPHSIQAYSVNIAGSLIGIGLFVFLSSLSTFPLVWFVVAATLLAAYVGRGRERWIDLGLIAALVLAAWLACRDTSAIRTIWSPYQKLVLTDKLQKMDDPSAVWPGNYLIAVNNAGYQGIIDLSPTAVAANPRIPDERRGLSQYDIPLMFHDRPHRVLVVGAGSGNDVAGALRGGAEEVVAVEIDPAIIELGRQYHPERPYDSKRVTVVTDDARSYFATTPLKFDLIIFGLLDSHTTTAMTNARLDHYVYTRESIERARSLLTDHGVVVLSFEAVKPYIADRMAHCLREVFGREPLAFRIPQDATGWGGAMFVAGDQTQIAAGLEQHPQLSASIARWQVEKPLGLTYNTSIATDDWPYIYLENCRIPVLYYCLTGLMLLLALYSTRRLQLPGMIGEWRAAHWHFFFLGAAFLLLEVQNISKASVVLGNTWIVNAVIIAAILLMILLANLIAARFPRLSQRLVGGGLIGTCLALYFVDLSQFGFLPYATKAVLVGALTTLPILFSGLIFIRSFASVERKDLALGANMFGSLVGGLLQSITFVVGIKALLLVVAGFYVLALLTRPEGIFGKPTTDGASSEMQIQPAFRRVPEPVSSP